MKDTDADWTEIARHEPFYGVLTHPDYLQANLNDESLGRFWASGRRDMEWQVDLLRSHYGEFKPQTALDFGCGVGRLTRAMSTIAGTVHGVDVAPAMLEIARRDAPSNVVYTDEIPDLAVDWINSLIVFQHIPPSRGVEILARLMSRLRSGGAITVHVTIGREVGASTLEGMGVEMLRWDGEAIQPLISRQMAPGGMMMFDYDLGQVVLTLNRAGLTRLTMQHTNHGGHHGVILIGRKG